MTENQNDGAASPHEFTHSQRVQIFGESVYIVGLLLLFIVAISFLWWDPEWYGLELADESVRGAKIAKHDVWSGADGARPGSSAELRLFGLTFMAGLVGGATYALKWLYYSVGYGPLDKKNNPNGWGSKRVLWRLLVPLLSAVLAVAFYATLASGLLNLEIDTANPAAFAAGLGFLVGYFSDRAAAKLKQIALVLFGTEEEQLKEAKKLIDELDDRKLQELVGSKLDELVERKLAERDANESPKPDAGDSEGPVGELPEQGDQ